MQKGKDRTNASRIIPDEREERLKFWQSRLDRCRTAYESELNRMRLREKLYDGDAEYSTENEIKKAPYLRNIVRELIEAQIDSNVPSPKVIARRECDEWKAALIEDMIRSELARMHVEEQNDLMERIVPLQGAGFYQVEWDESVRDHMSVGRVTLKAVHPDSLIPQEGVANLDDMDYFFLKIPTTKGAVFAKYGIDVSSENEREPELRSHTGEISYSEELVTVYCAFFRNTSGRIGLYSWCGDVVLLDLEDYRARRVKRCVCCHMPEPEETGDDGIARCPGCGGDIFEYCNEEYMTLKHDIVRSDGSVISHMREITEQYSDEKIGNVDVKHYEPLRIPHYMPNVSPIIMQKCVSTMNGFLGDSDADALEGAQRSLNSLYAKIFSKLFGAGSFVSLPNDATIDVTGEDMQVIRLANPSDKAMIDVYNLQAQVSVDVNLSEHIYEQSRQVIGITDSYQGRRDTTATSGSAKQYAAQLAAGRLESKREMKRSAYARIFEAIFQYVLAYADEPRDIVARDRHGNVSYRQFVKWDFLELDAAGNYYWNDDFIFECDTSAPLAQDRAAMWQEARMYFTQGAYGNPQDPHTRAFFWSVMDKLHYPNAVAAKELAEKEIELNQNVNQNAVPDMNAISADGAQANKSAGAELIARALASAKGNASAEKPDPISAMRAAMLSPDGSGV